MIDEPADLIPYHVSYSGMVLDGLRVFAGRARERGFASDFVKALKTIDRRLRIYPQFGQPLRELATESGQEWVAVVRPLVIRYVLYEERRVVCVVSPMDLLTGPDSKMARE